MRDRFRRKVHEVSRDVTPFLSYRCVVERNYLRPTSSLIFLVPPEGLALREAHLPTGHSHLVNLGIRIGIGGQRFGRML